MASTGGKMTATKQSMVKREMIGEKEDNSTDDSFFNLYFFLIMEETFFVLFKTIKTVPGKEKALGNRPRSWSI